MGQEIRRTLSCLFGEMCREDDIILDEQIAIGRRALEKWHALALDSLHEPRLRDTLAHQRDDVSVQVGQITCEAKQGLVIKKNSKRGERKQVERDGAAQKNNNHKSEQFYMLFCF